MANNETNEVKEIGETAFPAMTGSPWCPDKCPITQLPFFMWITHPSLGLVPTYGGPFDSYTIPEMEGESDEEWHNRELTVERYDHDVGGWVEPETIDLLIVSQDRLIKTNIWENPSVDG